MQSSTTTTLVQQDITNRKSKAVAPTPGIKDLRDAIPKHCFEADEAVSVAYIIADLTAAFALALIALQIPAIESPITRFALWTAYGVAQGFLFTGIWILAHECGHGALFKGRGSNDSFGLVLHSLLMVPYFPWKFTHARHHRYANNMQKDTAFVPSRKEEPTFLRRIKDFFHFGEDAPLLNLLVLVGHQLFGWPMYMLFNSSAGDKSTGRADQGSIIRKSHYDPTGHLFLPSERPYVVITDIALALVMLGLYQIGLAVGFVNLGLLYFIPYLWVNNWIVAITYLHHTHPEAEHYDNDAWTFQKGALATVDRDFGLVGKHLFHGIIEFHVVHHLFPRIPFYYAEEATDAIRPLLGAKYLREGTSFVGALWKTFASCEYVEPSTEEHGALRWAQRK